ncbi:hypothetical protein [Natrialba asiatica]|uniref:Uncharacterized protein n=1 Tax=Natrialba asiatica (strain ATCC 700177 / DSM 12278 / JCM 9576 / FERM P-10747 / NBRC 102637 / 172P1) TaxID=29540 RepID=M0AGM4_NATA1|nr:hypothetical protein [Natrialba asiatica]ELY97880.1 hypothetical protein C481_18130 [Natrialba asiatica DSM 12278]
MTDDTNWLRSRKTTNQLLAFGIVVLAAGFVSVGDLGPASIRFVAETLLVVILVCSIALFLALLARTDDP